MKTFDLDTDEGLRAAAEFLMRDGNLRVPAGRYGHDTYWCVPVALAVAAILDGEKGEPTTEDELDALMGLVVNSHDDVAYLLVNYGPEYGIEVTELLD